jgi:hypothetical protein
MLIIIPAISSIAVIIKLPAVAFKSDEESENFSKR